MNITGKTEAAQSKIEILLGTYLRFRGNGETYDGPHLDEDSMSAFVEGNLTQREALPLVYHLIDCSFCRKVSAELIQLENAFAAEAQPVIAETNSPTKVSEILSGILGRIFGVNEGVVFAHQESDENEEDTDGANDQKDE